MFSTPLLRHEARDGRLEPCYLDDRFTSLARTLALHYDAFTGQPVRALEAALDAAPELTAYDPRVVTGLRKVIEEFIDLEVSSPVKAWRIREAVFEAAARSNEVNAAQAFAEATTKLGLRSPISPEHLYADLKPERLVRIARPLPSPTEIISRYNFRLLQGYFLHADRVRVETDGRARAIWRLAKLHGLIVQVLSGPREGEPLRVEVTGPLSLFHLTRKYGHALASFVPACVGANRFRVDAWIRLRETSSVVTVTHADRVLAARGPPREFDSKLEERLFIDFLALGSRWSIAREAEMIQLGPTAFFPDFTFLLRSDPPVRVDLEIVGFWTREYLDRKRSLMTQLAGRKLIFCVDERLCCDRERATFPYISFSRRVPAEKVLQALEEIAGGLR